MLVTQVSHHLLVELALLKTASGGSQKEGGLFTTRDAFGWVLLRDYRLITLII